MANGRVVAEGPVNLVADQEDVALLGKARPALASRRPWRRRPVGLTGRVDDDALGPRGDGGRDAVGVDAEVGIGVDQDRRAAGQRRPGGGTSRSRDRR